MKIAITADLHLTTLERNPERYHALQNILEQMLEDDLRTLIIAGDLFDASNQNYAELDRLCQTSKFKDLEILVIRGNHDFNLKPESITAGNVKIFTQPLVKTFSGVAIKFLFLPYLKEKTMGEYISEFVTDLNGDWVLIGHGDWIEGMGEVNPLEPGIYMPLTRVDIETFRPAKVILGHIHKPMSKRNIYYAGSPVALAISETGHRRFLVFDTETGLMESKRVATEVLYFNEAFVVLPAKDEESYIKEQISQRISGWGLSDDEISKVEIKIKLLGYSSDKRALLQTVTESFRPFKFYQGQGPDLSEVSIADDVNRAEIADRVSDWLAQQNLNSGNGIPEKEQILLQALHTIYGD